MISFRAIVHLGSRRRCMIGSEWWIIAALSLASFFNAQVWAQESQTAQASRLMQSGNFHEAETLLRELARSHSSSAEIHGNLGVCLSQQGKLADAAAEYRRSLEIKPNQPDVMYNLGLAEFKQGDFKSAIRIFESLVQKRPEDKRSVILLGMSHFGLRQYDKATLYLRKAVQADLS